MQTDYEAIIIGGGPAGVAAGIYAARKRLKTLLVAEEIGGQSTVSSRIENWVGTPVISGADLGKAMRSHLDSVADTGGKDSTLTLALGERAVSLAKSGDGFIATTTSGKALTAKAVLIATGAAHRKLDIPGADRFEHKGVTYCASCDGPVFSGQDVAVVGGGNAGFDAASQLLAYAKSVTLLHRRSEFKADPETVEKVLAHPNMRTIMPVEPVAVEGGQFVTGLVYKDINTGETHELPVAGVFVEIGVVPSTDLVKGLLELDQTGHIPVDARTQRTAVAGVWAAGDCTDELYHQNNIAAGDGAKAMEDLYLWFKKQ